MTNLRDRLAAAIAPRYLVDRELAAGGMGVVFLGRDPTLGREVAIKVLPPELATAVAVERFLQEARLLASLAHPNIVPIFDAQHAGELLWFVMPRIRGDTLAHRLASGPLPLDQVRRLGLNILDALEHAHAHGVIHRDIKPGNIFLDGERALLADFGVALLDAHQADTLTGTDQVIGTLRYMAPEQRAGQDASVQTDLYAAGVVLFEAATGKRWESVDTKTTQAWRALPRSLGRALRGALRSDPARRWPDARAFRAALAQSRRWTFGRVAAGLAVLAIVGAAVIGARGTFSARQAVPRRAALVVLPFGSSGDSLGTHVANLAAVLIGFSQVRALPWVDAEHLTRDSARRVADHIVTGRISAQAGTLEIQVDDAAGRTEAFEVRGDSSDVASWAHAVADSLVSRLFPSQLIEFRQLADARTNRRALDAYSEGQSLFQSGRWHDAEVKFAEAEAADHHLVQASWQKLVARQWQSLPFKDDLDSLAARTEPMPEPLPRLLRAQVDSDLDGRMALYDSLRREYPDYPMVRQQYANELFSRGPLIGRPLRDGIEAFRESGRDLPQLDQANTYTQTIWGAVRIGDEKLAREQLRMRHAPKGDDWTQVLWLAVNGRFRRWLAVPARELMLILADSADIVTLSRAVRMGLDVDDPWDQDAIGRFLERRATTDSQRANALAAQASAMLLVGQPLEALRRLERGAAAAPRDGGYRLQCAEWRLLLPLLPGAPIALSASVQDSGRQLLRAIPATDTLWPRAAWALAIDAISRQDAVGRDSLIALLHARAAAPWIDDLARYAEAFALGAAGNVDSALALSRRIHRVPRDAEAGLRGPFVRAFVYLGRGQWRHDAGDWAGAEAEWIWHENNDIASRPHGEPEQGEMDAALSGVARLLRAENLMHLDGRNDACKLLDRVATLWRGAEPSLRLLQVRVTSGKAACRQ